LLVGFSNLPTLRVRISKVVNKINFSTVKADYLYFSYSLPGNHKDFEERKELYLNQPDNFPACYQAGVINIFYLYRIQSPYRFFIFSIKEQKNSFKGDSMGMVFIHGKNILYCYFI